MFAYELRIPTVPVGSIKTEQDGDDLFLLLHVRNVPGADIFGVRLIGGFDRSSTLMGRQSVTFALLPGSSMCAQSGGSA